MRKLRFVRCVLLELGLIMSLCSMAQIGPPPVLTTTFIPPSPDVASLGKFGNIPVGLHTGVPQISVPIHTIKNKDIEFPISLDYHAGGVKVDEMAGTTGLGFALNAGGAIFSVVNGHPDLGTNGFLSYSSHPDFSNFNPDYNNQTQYIYAKDVALGDIDSQPDIFHYNYLGNSGRFTFDKAGNTYPIPFRKIKIETEPFKITDELGNQYIYAAAESQRLLPNGCNDDMFSALNIINSTYKLSKIISSKGAHVDINYRSIDYSYSLGRTKQDYFLYPKIQYGCSDPPTPIDCIKVQDIDNGQFISSIVSSEGTTVEFIYSDGGFPIVVNGGNETLRRDLEGIPAITRIKISYQGILKKTFKLNYAYQSARGAPEPFTPDSFKYYRLLLTSVEEIGKNPYVFYYNDAIAMPARFLGGSDAWGYYNGTGSGNMLPELDVPGLDAPGANKEVNVNANQALILNRVKYPTSGETHFEYESNYYSKNAGQVETKVLDESAGVSSAAGFYTSSFNIPTGAYNLNVSVSNFQCPGSVDPDLYCQLKIRNTNTNESYYYQENTNDLDFVLQSGPYEIAIDNANCDCNGSLSWNRDINVPVDPNIKYYVGGLRIKKIVNYPGYDSPPLIKEYQYNAPGEPEEKSSGYLLYLPSFTYPVTVYRQEGLIRPSGCQYLSRVADSVFPLSFVNGSSIGYEYVTELIGEDGHGGKTVTKFKITSDIVGDPSIPFTPSTNYEWLRGLVEEKHVYAYEKIEGQDVFREIESQENEYEIKHTLGGSNLANENKVAGMKIMQRNPEMTYSGTSSLPIIIPATFYFSKYYNVSAWFFMKKSIEKSFDRKDNNKVVDVVTNYYYDNPEHAQLSEVEKIVNGKSEFTSYTYPADYSSILSGPIAAMKNPERNMHAIPIETTMSQKKGTASEEVLAAQFVTYDFIGVDDPGTPGVDERFILPVKVEAAELDKPKTTFDASISSGVATDNSYVDKQYITYYPESGNVREIQKPNDFPVTLLWGYNNTLLVAEIKNTTYAQVRDALGGDAIVASIAESTALSQGQIDLLNNLRGNVSLQQAQITTYTHKPLVGVETLTNPAGQTISYDYDDVGRLVTIKDHNQYIVKKYTYHYKK